MGVTLEEGLVVRRRHPRRVVDRPGRWGILAIWGPGLIVMLADTDAGCLITAVLALVTAS